MTLPHKRIWCKPKYDSWDQYGHWYLDGAGGGTEYVRADIADALTAEVAALRAENERLRACMIAAGIDKVSMSAAVHHEYWRKAEAALKEALKGGE